jgi:hypothetical protein
MLLRFPKFQEYWFRLFALVFLLIIPLFHKMSLYSGKSYRSLEDIVFFFFIPAGNFMFSCFCSLHYRIYFYSIVTPDYLSSHSLCRNTLLFADFSSIWQIPFEIGRMYQMYPLRIFIRNLLSITGHSFASHVARKMRLVALTHWHLKLTTSFNPLAIG